MANKDKHTGSPRRKPERDHLDALLDEALKGTFPASDPVAISIVEQTDETSVAGKPGRRGA